MRARRRSYFRALALKTEVQALLMSRQILRGSLSPNLSQLRAKQKTRTKNRWTKKRMRKSLRKRNSRNP